MVKYVVELIYQYFEFENARDAAKFLEDAVKHSMSDVTSFRIKVVKVEKDGEDDEQ